MLTYKCFNILNFICSTSFFLGIELSPLKPIRHLLSPPFSFMHLYPFIAHTSACPFSVPSTSLAIQLLQIIYLHLDIWSKDQHVRENIWYLSFWSRKTCELVTSRVTYTVGSPENARRLG